MKNPDSPGGAPPPIRFLDFGPFRVDPVRRLLLADGRVVPLKAKPFDTLLALLAHRGEDIRRQDLLREVWPDTIVEENNLSQCISAVRKALDEDPRDHRYVVTVPGLGYRFVAPVVEVSEAAPSAAPAAAGRRRANFGVALAALALIAIGIAAVGAWGRSRQGGLESASPAAREAYLKGRFYWNQRTAESLGRALGEFARAVEIDPRFALAHSGLSDTNALLWEYTSEWRYAVAAKASAEAAIRLGESRAEVLTSHANVAMVIDGDLALAERDFRRALALDPSYPTARHWYAWCLLGLGRRDEAIAELRRARQLDPLSPIVTSALGTALYYAGRPQEAIGQYRRALALDPSFARAHLALGQVFTELGRHGEAIAELEAARRLSGESAEAIGALAYAYGRAGKREHARAMLAELEQRDRAGSVPSLAFALAYTAVGQTDRAREALAKARGERTVSEAVARFDPRLAAARRLP